MRVMHGAAFCLAVGVIIAIQPTRAAYFTDIDETKIRSTPDVGLSVPVSIGGGSTVQASIDAKARTSVDSIEIERPKPQVSNRVTTRVVRIAEGEPTLAPFSHIQFCITYPDDCRRKVNFHRPFRMTEARLATLHEVNLAVNKRIAPVRIESPIKSWTIAPRAGDCNDYAVTKRHELLARGFPSYVLTLAVVRTSQGEGHLVLVVRSHEGDYVLDNLRPQPVLWTRSNYQWLRIQSARDPQRWTVATADYRVRTIPVADAKAGARLSSAN
jgi:predicted transglutaminase-like cysteine proteinase